MSRKEPLVDTTTRIAVIKFRSVRYVATFENGEVVGVRGTYVKSADKSGKLPQGDGQRIFKHPHKERFYLLGEISPVEANRIMVEYNQSRQRRDGETEI